MVAYSRNSFNPAINGNRRSSANQRVPCKQHRPNITMITTIFLCLQYVHRVSQNVTTLACYNFDVYCDILRGFGRPLPASVAEFEKLAERGASVTTFLTAPPGVRCSLKSSLSSSPMLYLIMGGLANSSWFVSMPGAWTIRLACSFPII